MSSVYDYSKRHTLCWECKNATRPWNCPWVEKFGEVEGWMAKPTNVGKFYNYESFHVIDCPKFKRDSFLGGTEWNLFGKRESTSLDDEDCQTLAEAICERAVEDWKFLDYGLLDEIAFCGGRIFKSELLEFFFSEWFESLLESFTERTPQNIRRYLKIKESMRPKKEGVR